MYDTTYLSIVPLVIVDSANVTSSACSESVVSTTTARSAGTVGIGSTTGSVVADDSVDQSDFLALVTSFALTSA